MRSAAALLLLALAAAYLYFDETLPPAGPVRVDHVIDGDSLSVIADGRRVTIRLSGIDAVELNQYCRRAGAEWACGAEARHQLARLVGSGRLVCARLGQDRYARTLAQCRTAPAPDGIDIGGEMVRLGWAVATRDTYRGMEAEAEARRRGIWEGEFARPADWRADLPRDQD